MRRVTTSKYLSSLGEAVAALNEQRNYFYPLRHGTMRIGVYAPSGIDDQTPHEPDDVIFVEAHAVHCFENMSEDFLTWVIFRGPSGGEPSASR
jgi:hypothetical protein